MLTVTMRVGDELLETLTVNAADVETADCGRAGVPVAPTVEFVTKWCGERRPEKVAYDATGRNAVSGKLTLGVSVRNRNNAMVRFDCDLWRLPFDFHPDALSLLEGYWDLLNLATPERVRARMEWHFSQTFIQFDVLEEQAGDWREFLTEVLSGRSSYVGLDLEHRRCD